MADTVPPGMFGPMQGVTVSAPPNAVSPVTIIPAETGFAAAHVAFDASDWIEMSSSKLVGPTGGGGPPGGGGGAGIPDITARMTSRAAFPAFVSATRPKPPVAQVELVHVSSTSTTNDSPIVPRALATSLLPGGIVAL